MRFAPLLCVIPCAALILGGCDHSAAPTEATMEAQPSFAATATHQTERGDFLFGGFNPCTQEETPLTGRFLFQVTMTERPTGGFHVELLFNGAATGVGLTTGASYRAHLVQHDSFNTNGGAQATETFVTRLHVTTPSAQNDFYAKFIFHITIDATGRTTILRETPTGPECR